MVHAFLSRDEWAALKTRPLYHLGKSPCYPVKRRLRALKKGNIFAFPGNRSIFLCFTASSVIGDRYEVRQRVILFARMGKIYWKSWIAGYWWCGSQVGFFSSSCSDGL